MSAVAGATANTSISAAGPTSSSTAENNNSSKMPSSASVLTETTRLTNGSNNSHAPQTTAEGSSAMDARNSSSTTEPNNHVNSTCNEVNHNYTKTGSSSSSSSCDAPLPPDLKKILNEVARTGSCSWLSWNPSYGNDKVGPAAATSAVSSSTAALGSTETAPMSWSHTVTGPGTSAGKAQASACSSSSNNPNTTTKYALGLPVPSNRAQSRRPYNPTANRLGTSSPHYPSAAAGAGGGVPKPTRKKHRNGVKVSNRRRLPDAATGGSKTQTGTTPGTAGAAGSRKRPLFLIRTTASGTAAVAGGGGVFSPGSVGSGRTSGSEPDDSTQYECDSEGTSATSCSELSTERRDHQLRNMQRVAIPASKKPPAAAEADEVTSSNNYRCLKDVFRVAIGSVLDHWYRHRGGYKLSPAEKRRSEKTRQEISKSSLVLVNGDSHNSHRINNNVTTSSDSNTTAAHSERGQHQQQWQLQHQNSQSSSDTSKLKQHRELSTKRSFISAEDIFHQRRQRLLMMLARADHQRGTAKSPTAARRYEAEDDGPPFTIQRVAEVLIAPERYYTQTHKLCNCLEKLLLVSSSTSAFGGSTGGITSQSRLEEKELAALADEKGRLESEFRQRALKRRCSALSDDVHMDGTCDSAHGIGSPSRDDARGTHRKGNDPSPEKNTDNESESSSREMLEAAARSLRTKFDHVGIDPHSSAVANRDVRSIAENRGMTNSPPPPSLAMSAAAASNIALPGHTGVGNFVRQHLPEQNTENLSIARVPSPILFSQQSTSDSSAMAPLHAAPNMHTLHMHHPAPLAGVSMGSTPFDVVTIEAGRGGASAPSGTNLAGPNEGADLEGRSSASNSDVDSESDDVSFDDSASDRSDGSDSGHYEPFTAARAMALNRIQQQQRLHSRGGVLTSLALHQSEGGGGASGAGAAGFRAPDSEYQSGDSIDSTRGEDSGGSDSSSSDLAD